VAQKFRGTFERGGKNEKWRKRNPKKQPTGQSCDPAVRLEKSLLMIEGNLGRADKSSGNLYWGRTGMKTIFGGERPRRKKRKYSPVGKKRISLNAALRGEAKEKREKGDEGWFIRLVFQGGGTDGPGGEREGDGVHRDSKRKKHVLNKRGGGGKMASLINP